MPAISSVSLIATVVELSFYFLESICLSLFSVVATAFLKLGNSKAGKAKIKRLPVIRASNREGAQER